MDTIKLTPLELIESWNVLDEVLQANTNPGFTSQAKRLQFQIRDDVTYWNGLSPEERKAIKDEPYTVQITKIDAVPQFYSNDSIEPLSRFMSVDLPEKEPALKKLVESKKEE